jgi:hypothetical protein
VRKSIDAPQPIDCYANDAASVPVTQTIVRSIYIYRAPNLGLAGVDLVVHVPSRPYATHISRAVHACRCSALFDLHVPVPCRSLVKRGLLLYQLRCWFQGAPIFTHSNRLRSTQATACLECIHNGIHQKQCKCFECLSQSCSNRPFVIPLCYLSTNISCLQTFGRGGGCMRMERV